MILGIDCSNYQAGINMAGARSAGMEFAICKVSEGSTYRSPAWPAQRDGARQAGLLLCGYHYVKTDDPARQAANCRSWLGDPSIPLMLDWEAGGGNWANFLAVLAAFRTAGLRVVLGYIPRWWWQQQGAPALTTGLALVSSRYPSTATGSPASIYRNVTVTTWSAYGGLTPTILQFTDRATVTGMTVDCNAYLGNADQLAALLGGGNHSDSTTSGDGELDDTQAKQLALLASQLVIGDDPSGNAWGWQTFAGGTGERLTVVDYLRRSNQRMEAIAAKLDAFKASVETGKTSLPAGQALSEADVQRIAAAVIALLGHKTSS